MKLCVTRTTMRLHPEARQGDFIYDPECPCEICVSGGPNRFRRGYRRYFEEVEIGRVFEQGSLFGQDTVVKPRSGSGPLLQS
jgi:hypothetical protein